jgi:tetratricopeptide (TPR) repeat protein
MKKLLMPLVFILCAELLSNCAGMAASAEEYYSIGMAYFEIGKFEEAEIWLNRAKSADKTMVASQYNLGRLAFEKKQYNEAAKLFEGILKKDPDNILALKAAAYTRINTGDLETAENYYARLQELIPESADNGYNHALVLYAMKRYSDAEEILKNYFLSMLENSEMQLLFARCQKAQNKIEAIDSYSNWLNNNSDVRARYEYAQLLELHELYARAIEEYRKALSETSSSEKALNREIRFSLAKLLLIADNESREGITELQTAVNDGFNNIEALENLLVNEKISAVNKDNIRNIISGVKR